MPDATVILTRCEEYDHTKISDNLQRHFELLGGLQKFIKRGDSVLLKPNFIAPRSAHHATQTHPVVIIETAKLLKDFGAKPFVADSPAWSNVENCIKKLKLQEPLKKLNVPYKQLKRAKKCKIGDNTVGISSSALDADVIINLPKFKSHQQLVATFAIKNMFGTVCGKRKAIWHFRKGKKPEKFCRFLIDIFKYLNPALTIIDAVYVMDRAGPIKGRTRPLGYLISGTEPIALEITCAKLINLKPEDVPIIETARRIGFGCSDFGKIEILGDGLPEKPCTDFELPKLIPIRFSLAHVCRSIAKQIVLLAKSGIEKNKNSW
jgi:uncharacterized protein (DUF362 family)